MTSWTSKYNRLFITVIRDEIFEFITHFRFDWTIEDFFQRYIIP